MSVVYLTAPGDIVAPEQCTLAKATEVIALVKKLPFHQLIETRMADDASFEVVVIDMEIEVPQHPVHDIHRVERIAVKFSKQGETLPDLLALREDFPRVPHINLRESEKPRSLCIYEEKYAVVMMQWTAVSFLERIRQWLALTAIGGLHAADQPLEPLITPVGYIVLPEDVISSVGGMGSKRLSMILRESSEEKGPPVLIAESGEEKAERAGLRAHIAYIITTPPVVHGVVNQLPLTIADLHNLLASTGFDFLGFLKGALQEMKDGQGVNAQPIFIIKIPKCRETGQAEETDELLAFAALASIEEIGIEIGIWQKTSGVLGAILLADVSGKGKNISIGALSPLKTFNRSLALGLSGIETSRSERNIALIGAGALGSQFISAVVRMGLGRWVVIDDDSLMPHNVGRHMLEGFFVGCRKAHGVVHVLNSFFPGKVIARSINADVMFPPTAEKENIRLALQQAEIIVDASTSVPAARFLALDMESPGRRISIFLSPSGRDAVMLAEPEDRHITLDLLEMQYYRALLQNQNLHDHLHRDDAARIRYAQSCRDISFILPQDQVMMHAGLCAKAFRRIYDDPSPRAVIWKGEDDGSVETIEIEIADPAMERIGEWTVCYDSYVIEKIFEVRKGRLPNETGGVLLGSFDQQRKIVYVVDTILSPPDSIEWPTSYIRGCEGLSAQVERAKKVTMGMVGYVGEWHSHPGASIRPSSDDVAAFQWLIELMDFEGRPALMAIAGEKRLGWFLGKMVAA